MRDILTDPWIVTPIAIGVGMTKPIAVVVRFATQVEHNPVGDEDASDPGVLGVTGDPDEGDAK